MASTTVQTSECGSRVDKPRLEIFFDGACPICSREVAMIRKLDAQGAIECTDIATSEFSAEARGLDPSAIHREIHASEPDGTVITGVEVFRQIYGRLGFHRWVALSRIALVSRLLELGYAVFARYRRKLGGVFRWLSRPRSAA